MIRSFPLAITLALLIAPGGSLRADHLALADEGRLTGTVKSINQDGVIELASPLTAEPLLLRGEAVKKITFSDPDDSVKIPSSRVELNNGDVIPAEIESLDDERLTIVSPAAGRLQVPRTALKTLMLGIYPDRVIYAGPKSLEEFHADSNHGENWRYEQDELRIDGPGRIYKKLDPAKQFSVKFTLDWRNTPNFLFYFAEPLLTLQPSVDRYCFQFSTGGIELKRESAKGKRLTQLATLNRRPDQYSGNHLKVEIRVDRSDDSRPVLYLFLNDEPEGRYMDPVDDPPAGGGISLVSNIGADSSLGVSDLRVMEWNHDGDRHRTEDRGDPKTDALVGRRGDRFGGHLISIKAGGGKPSFIFKSDFQDEPLELPDSEVSTVFFGRREDVPKEEAHPFVLKLQGQGALRVSSCSFPGDKIEVMHPLLGRLSFSRDGVAALERIEGKGAAP